MKLPWDRGGLRTYLVAIALICARPGGLSVGWGVPLVLLGVWLHVYAKGSLWQDQTVAMGGPYRFVRHPFYAANFLLDMGIAVMSGWGPLMLLLPVWWLLVYLPVMRREERHLTRLFPAVYPDYQRRLPRLLPLRRPLPAGGPGFSWSNPNITSDTVLPRVLRALACVVLFALWREARLVGWDLLGESHGLAHCGFALLIVLWGLSWQLTRHLRHRTRILPALLSGAGARAVFAVSLLAVAGISHRFETESDFLLPAVALLVLAASLALYTRRREARLAAEGLGLIALVVLCELIWLAALPFLFYAALALDRRLALRAGERTAPAMAFSIQPLPALLYLGLIVVGSMVALFKELV